jgi:Ran GTPase-activating protein (RanGAP) involved in mRNA processing and transport
MRQLLSYRSRCCGSGLDKWWPASETEWIAVFQALKENTSVKCIRLSSSKFTKRSAEVVAEYLESSQTLQTIKLFVGFWRYSQEIPTVISLLLKAVSRNASVTKLHQASVLPHDYDVSQASFHNYPFSPS